MPKVSVALAIALVPTLLIFDARVEPIASLLWWLHPAPDLVANFWQARLADVMTLALVTFLVYYSLSISKLHAKLRPNGIVYTLVALACALPVAWSLFVAALALRSGELGDVFPLLHYDQRLMVKPMLFLGSAAVLMLVVSRWMDIRFVIRRRLPETAVGS